MKIRGRVYFAEQKAQDNALMDRDGSERDKKGIREGERYEDYHCWTGTDGNTAGS